MRQLSKQLVILSLSAILSGCASFKTSDWQASITLPASEDCYSFHVMSGKEVRLPAESKLCKDKKARSIWIDSDSYRMLKEDILRNCQYARCKQITGAFDDLFLKLNTAILKVDEIKGGKK